MVLERRNQPYDRFHRDCRNLGILLARPPVKAVNTGIRNAPSLRASLGKVAPPGRRNSGRGAVLASAIWTSMLVFLLTLGLKSRMADGAIWSFSRAELRTLIAGNLPSLSAIFAGTYGAFPGLRRSGRTSPDSIIE